MFRKAAFGVLATTICLVGCSSSSTITETEWLDVLEEQLSDTQKKQQQQAVAAREALFSRLMARLTQVIQAEGAAKAIPICQAEAPQLAEAVAKEFHVKIGRTSTKLRNPANAPPAWAQSRIEQQPTKPTFLAHRDGRLACLLPIRLKAQCLTCHGSPEQIQPDVREILTQRYPKDQATGYREDDLRGWFWVEVPKE